ncbi:glycosyltransferase [Mucilaginibacter pocheonensis]|uniref:Glycosyltransferase involved in cell wall biosynthesis n=1 Tax=Mucilaginibacter pocheonensis TaxID=398050 RepID=A0ABU1T4I4_9SPHI|nr:glycosyltransferase [Mucilaginibacter pocheonensis]MDR6940219.1 glycosyltransferase involved in cell wall biosynthesis [Mucilaginibacter pocheonensis]
MKKKIFLIVGSLGAGGSERVYWLLSQYFNKPDYAVAVVFLDANDRCFSMDIEGIRFIDLKTIKASRSFFKLYALLKKEKPYAVFSTNDHINLLTGMVGLFLKVPVLIARVSNNQEQMKEFCDNKSKFYNFFTRLFFAPFNFVVCQTSEMRVAMARLHGIKTKRIKVISNPVLRQPLIKEDAPASAQKKLIVVVRLAKEKGLFRLIDIMQELPANYTLSIVGEGPLLDELKAYVALKQLNNRIAFMGKISGISSYIIQHDLMVLSSFTEGFPNVVLEALSVGVPVVSFRVDGIRQMIRNGFNGFVAEQHDTAQLKELIIKACSQTWPHEQIKADVYERFALDKIGQAYENLLLEY